MFKGPHKHGATLAWPSLSLCLPAASNPHPLLLALLSSSSSYFSSFSPSLLPLLLMFIIVSFDRMMPGLSHHHTSGGMRRWAPSLPLFTTRYDSRRPLGVRVSNTGHRAWTVFLALLAHIHVVILLLTTQRVIAKMLICHFAATITRRDQVVNINLLMRKYVAALCLQCYCKLLNDKITIRLLSAEACSVARCLHPKKEKNIKQDSLESPENAD